MLSAQANSESVFEDVSGGVVLFSWSGHVAAVLSGSAVVLYSEACSTFSVTVRRLSCDSTSVLPCSDTHVTCPSRMEITCVGSVGLPFFRTLTASTLRNICVYICVWQHVKWGVVCEQSAKSFLWRSRCVFVYHCCLNFGVMLYYIPVCVR